MNTKMNTKSEILFQTLKRLSMEYNKKFIDKYPRNKRINIQNDLFETN